MKKLLLNFILFLIGAIYLNGQSPIIADHKIAKLGVLNSIPSTYISAAKANLHIAYEHTSHGSQLVTGMQGLYNWKGSTYAFNNGGADGALDFKDHDISPWGWSDLGTIRDPDNYVYNTYDWARITRDYLEDPGNSKINVIMWSWCSEVSDISFSDVDRYLYEANLIEEDYPNIKFVYMTGHVDGTAQGSKLYLNNQRIRDYCITNNKILYDFADIESYDPDDNYYADKRVTDCCNYDYDGSGVTETDGGDPGLPVGGDKNWALDWQGSHTLNVDWFNCSPSHTYALNGNKKAYATWWLIARLAGWSGTNATPPTLTTTTISSIGTTTATGGGNVTSDGGSTVSSRGVCWSQTSNPTINDPHTSNGTGTGTFTSNITGLVANTTYYVRAYATNDAGTTYGNAVSFTTIVAPYLSLSVNSLTVPKTANSDGKFNISSNTDWEISTTADWLTISPTSGQNNSLITLTTTANNDEGRSAVVTISGTNVSSQTLTIIQEGSSTSIYDGPVWYVSTTGSDVTGDGSPTKPWASLYHACSKVSTSGHIINVNEGTYRESRQCFLSSRINIKGQGRDVTKIIMTFNTTYPCLKLESPNGWGNTEYGNQYIEGITFDGELTGLVPIGVNFRSNVIIRECAFYNFLDRGPFFNGQPAYDWTLDNPYNTYGPGQTDYPYMPDPNGWCTGNKFINNIVKNCARVSGTSAYGSVCLGTQDGFEMYGNQIDATDRHGFGLKFWSLGFNKNCDIHDNKMKVSHIGEGTSYEFAIEWWWSFGGDKFYNNELRGAFDIVHAFDHHSVGYSIRAYDNDIGRDVTPTTRERGILLEGRCEYVQIYRNHIHHVARAIYIPRQNYTGVDRLYHIDIYSNLAVKLGQSATDYQTWGVYYPNYTDEDESKYVKIQNNVFEADPSLPRVTMFGIQLPNVYEQSYIYVENNIILNFDNSPIYASNARNKADNIFIRNNLCFGNGNSNNPRYENGFSTTLTNYTESGTVKLNPEFVSNNDYHLSSPNSPAYQRGINIGLDLDYDKKPWNNPPSIGAYEFASQEQRNVYIVSKGMRIVNSNALVKIYK